MGLKKGMTNNPKGRKKGVRNKKTAKFKDQLNELFEHHADDMHGWLAQIAKDNPKDAFEVLSKFIVYLYPKLASSENKVTIDDAEWLERIKEPKSKDAIVDPEV